jgi:hypothetical protein
LCVPDRASFSSRTRALTQALPASRYRKYEELGLRDPYKVHIDRFYTGVATDKSVSRKPGLEGHWAGDSDNREYSGTSLPRDNGSRFRRRPSEMGDSFQLCKIAGSQLAPRGGKSQASHKYVLKNEN